MTRRLAMASVCLACAIQGCSVGPRYSPPATSIPGDWHEGGERGLVRGEADVQAWWTVFGDETLSRLIERATEGNLDLRIAVLRIREARALRGVAAGELLPSLSGRGSYNRSKASANGPAAGIGVPGRGRQFADTVARGVAGSSLSQDLASVAPGATGVTNSVANALVGLVPGRDVLPETKETDMFASGFDASWEMDVFGGIRHGVNAADEDVAAIVEDYHAVFVSLLAEVATTYVDLRAFQCQIDATRSNIELQRQTLQLTQSRYDAQFTSELDVHQAQTNLATTESELPVLEVGRTLAIYRLSVLLGLEPAALVDELSVVQPIPSLSADVSVGIPTDIIRRRPDIRAAERRLAAQTSRIGVAVADLYPRFTLSGSFAFEATDLNHAMDERSITYGFGPSVRWNIFDGLRNLNRIAAQEAVAHQAYVTYERTLLTALEDVEASMVSYKREQVRCDALQRAAESARKTVQLAQIRYEDGLTDFQNVLDAQRSLVALENSLARSRGQVAVGLVAIYKALGGGWSAQSIAQQQYLQDTSGVLTDPVGFFLSGGKTAAVFDVRETAEAESGTTPASED